MKLEQMEAANPENSRLGADVDQRYLNESTPSQAALRREVWCRAQSRCEKCGSNYALEIDHILPRAKGGGDSQENLRLLCRSCNQRAAIEQFGVSKMDQYRVLHS